MQPAKLIGLGVSSPYGNGVEQFWNSICLGQSGMTNADPFDLGPEHEHMFGLLPDRLATAAGIAKLSIDEALQDAQLKKEDLGKFGIYIASAHSESRRLSRYVDFKSSGNCDLNAVLDAVGKQSLLSDSLVDSIDSSLERKASRIRNVKAACASPLVALDLAIRDLNSRRVDLAVVVAVDILSRIGSAGFASLGALASHSIRPFSPERDGTLIGEGAAAFILLPWSESGQVYRAQVHQPGLSGDCDKHPIQSNPTGAGIERSIRLALTNARTSPDAINAIIYHATGTPQNDDAELSATKRIFGSNLPHACALKPLIGHTMGAAPAMSLAAAAMILSSKIVPATPGVERLPRDCDSGLQARNLSSYECKNILVNGFGFGGINASTIISGPQEQV